ncbi:MAG TPA: hypothetical protein VGR88_04565 [Ktedonobacterales bacterium]|nr:hypothetical protein [Ktedonobacterales bacterium]
MPRRFRDTGQSIYEFGDTYLVRCPRCERRAEVASLPVASTSTSRAVGLFAPRRCVCAKCGYVKEWQGKKVSVGAAQDWYFGYPLWLQTPCCGQTLWAYNEPHLRFLEEFVAADLRERAPERRNSHSLTYAARLPRWLQSAANREEALRGLARLRMLLGE